MFICYWKFIFGDFFFGIQISLGKTYLTISVFFSASAVASVSVTSLSFHPLDVKNELKDMLDM